MHVIVTQQHIDKGTRKSAATCPIALAVNDCKQWKYHHVSVGVHEIHFFHNNTGVDSAQLPLIVQGFIADFDDGNNVQPFEFDVEIKEGYNPWEK